MISTSFIIRFALAFTLSLVLTHLLKTNMYQSMVLAFFIGTTAGFFPA